MRDISPERLRFVEDKEVRMRERFHYWDLLTNYMKWAIASIPDKLLEMDEHQLAKKVYAAERKRNYKDRSKYVVDGELGKGVKMKIQSEKTGIGIYGSTCDTLYGADNLLRERFWMEVNNAITENRGISPENIYVSVCTYNTWVYRILEDPERMAWVIHPIPDFEARMRTLLNRGLIRLEEIIRMPIQEQKCRCHQVCKCGEGGCACKGEGGCRCPTVFNAKIADVILKAYQMIELRVHGSIPQIINQRTLAVTMHAHSKNANNQKTSRVLPKSKEEIEVEISRLKEKLGVSPTHGVKVLDSSKVLSTPTVLDPSPTERVLESVVAIDIEESQNSSKLEAVSAQSIEDLGQSGTLESSTSKSE